MHLHEIRLVSVCENAWTRSGTYAARKNLGNFIMNTFIFITRKNFRYKKSLSCIK